MIFDACVDAAAFGSAVQRTEAIRLNTAVNGAAFRIVIALDFLRGAVSGSGAFPAVLITTGEIEIAVTGIRVSGVGCFG